ncbi:MAG: (5-formylfuran-3-yl)methyl phosphate synthase [Methylococcales bacterium]|nr:(5-formylfuran-3-yl)methyl phosphate synthase [Methylococcales bacterium]
MTGMLASVKNVTEAQIVLNANVDIIDLKQPEFGALGALPIELVAEIVTEINGRLPVSATVGDLPMDENLIFNAVCEMAKTGVNFVKIGFFPSENWQVCVQKLASITENTRLIAVLFADTKSDFSIISHLKTAKFAGVMLDTMDKKNGSLTDVMTRETITAFVELAKTHNLLCGLAGSLRLENIAPLLPLNADYLGFRGALCAENNRVQSLDFHALQQIRNAIHTSF